MSSGDGAVHSAPAGNGGLDGRVLKGDLLAGAPLLIALGVVSWPLALIGLIYVIASSMWLAAAHARVTLSRRQEAAAWLAPWLVAVALWFFVLAGVDGGIGAASVVYASVLATLCYLGWQVLALAARRTLG